MWQFGTIEIDGKRLKWTGIGSHGELRNWPLDQLPAGTWPVVEFGLQEMRVGVLDHFYGVQLKRSDADKLNLLKRALEFLLYGQASRRSGSRPPIESNGLGLNVITGILHAMWARTCRSFNSAAVAGMSRLLPEVSWKRDLRHYPQVLSKSANG